MMEECTDLSYQTLPLDDLVTKQGAGSATYKCPVLDGSLTLPMMLEDLESTSPNHPWAQCALPEGQIQQISYRCLAKAARRMASLMLQRFPDMTKENPVVAILASRDQFTYAALPLGCLRLGIVLFAISNRNSAAGVIHLLKVTGATYVIGTPDSKVEGKLLDAAREALPQLKVIPAPKYDELFGSDTHESYQNDVDLPPLRKPTDMHEVAMILHSSGSTNFPKPIYITHMAMVQWCRRYSYSNHDYCGECLGLHAFPLYHMGGFSNSIVEPISTGMIAGLFPPKDPPIVPTAELIIDNWKRGGVTVGITPPSFLMEFCQNSESLAFLKTLRQIHFGGAALPTYYGDLLSVEHGVRITNSWGATEIGVITNPSPPDFGTEAFHREWSYFRVNKNVLPFFRPMGQDDEGDLFEVCFVPTRCHLPSVFNDDSRNMYHTNDLVRKHPTDPTLFRIVGRADDQIMLANGEKTNPGPLEMIIAGDERVKFAIYFGRSRFQNGCLIQPMPDHTIDVTDERQVATFRNAIWPSVEKANKMAPSHSRLFKEMILVTSKDKPCLLVPKHTPNRNATLKLYEKEIEAIYTTVESASTSSADFPTEWTPSTCRVFIKAVLLEVMRPSGGNLTDGNLFEQGCDPLQATFIRNRLAAALRKSGVNKALPANWVYENPSIEQLASVFQAKLESSESSSSGDDRAAFLKKLQVYVEQFTRPYAKHIGSKTLPDKTTVLITGTTGTLGVYLLHCFATDTSVQKVYALNRPGKKDAYSRQLDAWLDRGLLESELNSRKIQIIEGDTARLDLGVDPALLEEIRDNVTLIVHNAWRLDFNLGIESFAPNIQGVRNLVELALSGPFIKPARIIFSSSMGVVGNHPASSFAPEEPANPEFVPFQGYSGSKYVSERILEEAPLQSTSIRICQLSGSRVNGAWNITDWFALLVKSAEVLGFLPDGDGVVCWIQTDVCAQAMTEFAHTDQLPTTLNIANPRPSSYSTMIRILAKELGVAVKPYPEWLKALEADNSDPVRNPAKKLLQFFSTRSPNDSAPGTEAFNMSRLETTKAELHSQSLKNASQLNESDYKSWLLYWQRAGLFSSPGA